MSTPKTPKTKTETKTVPKKRGQPKKKATTKTVKATKVAKTTKTVKTIETPIEPQKTPTVKSVIPEPVKPDPVEELLSRPEPIVHQEAAEVTSFIQQESKLTGYQEDAWFKCPDCDCRIFVRPSGFKYRTDQSSFMSVGHKYLPAETKMPLFMCLECHKMITEEEMRKLVQNERR